MSHDLYATRLYWQNGRGIAKLHGKTVPLDNAPDIGVPAVLEVDYIPEIGVANLQTRFERRRDMTPDEVKVCDKLLGEVVK